MEPKWGQDFSKTAKKSIDNIEPIKASHPPVRVAVLGAKMWPTWAQLGSQNRAKNDTKINKSKCWCFLRCVFGAPKTHQESIKTSEGLFYKKYYKTNYVLMIFLISGIEVGTKT